MHVCWHGSMPGSSIDPVVMAAATVLRLQIIVSRQIGATAAVLTVGSLQAGTVANVISDGATIRLNVRAFDEDVRKRALGATERLVNAESEASGVPPGPRRSPA